LSPFLLNSDRKIWQENYFCARAALCFSFENYLHQKEQTADNLESFGKRAAFKRSVGRLILIGVNV
jgi:hypothetical protein